MAVNSESKNTVWRLGILLHRVRDELVNCEEPIFNKYGITTEQYSVLAAMKYIGGPARVTDIARWLERSTNSVSMIIDRMVKAGLVTRRRDKGDRRAVYVTATSKGENAFKLATLPVLEFIQKILSLLSYEDKLTLISLLEKIKGAALAHLNPGADITKMIKNSITSKADFHERMVKSVLPSAPQAKRQGGKKKKAIR
jgi:DNA-binding MarR family transcriptional regulator